MFRNRIPFAFSGLERVKSILTGDLIAKDSEEFRHEREIEFLSSLSPEGLERILIGFGRNNNRSITAVRGPAEVTFLRNEIILFRVRTEAASEGAR